MYTLVTPSVLVGDLACRPHAQRLLRLLEEVLLLDAAALPALGDAALRADLAALTEAREAALAAHRSAPTHADVVAELQADLAAAAAGQPERRREGALRASTRLARLPAGGGLPDLREFVAAQALPAEDAAVPTVDEQAAYEAAGDALTAVWAADDLSPEQRRVLGGAWSSARASSARWQRDRRVALGPQADAVLALCAAVRGVDREVLGRVAAAHSGSEGWPAHMHEAAWTAHLSGRLRAVTHAQVLAAAAVAAAAGSDPDPVLVRTSLSPVLSAVTATTLQDLLADTTASALGAAWSAGRSGGGPRSDTGSTGAGPRGG